MAATSEEAAAEARALRAMEEEQETAGDDMEMVDEEDFDDGKHTKNQITTTKFD